jgi:hypothetical protein
MAYRLESSSILDYLVQKKLCHSSDLLLSVERLIGKNLNLQVQLSRNGSNGTIARRLLVKQGLLDAKETPKTDFEREWRLYQLLGSHDDLRALQAMVPEGINFDAVNAIQVFRYLETYSDLREFYAGTQQFSTKIATALGVSLAMLHQATFQREDYRYELDPESAELPPGEEDAPDFRGDLENLSPNVFKRVSADGLAFYRLYNRSQDLSRAIAKLEEDHQSCCLIHNDLKFRNILLHHDWAQWQPQTVPVSSPALRLPDDQGIIRVIDWEQWEWGDPALDMGALVAEYLRVWLKSLVLSRDIDLEVALRLAAVPLESLQPSLAALLQAYLAQFPTIMDAFPTFPERVLRFAGLGLIGAIQDRLHYREPFGNLEISMLQVAKSLLCHPEAAMMTIFGRTELNSSTFDPHAVGTGEIIPIPSTSGKNEPLTKVPLPSWVQQYSRENVIVDLIKSIRIDPPLIQHPAYASLDLTHPADGWNIDQKCEYSRVLPDRLRQAYLLCQVRNYLYDIYFSGEKESRCSSACQRSEIINNTVAGLNIDFYERIQAANRGTGFLDPNWIVIRSDGDRAQVEKNGLRLWVDPTFDLAMDWASIGKSFKAEVMPSLSVGTPVSLRLPNAYLVGDHYMAIANEGEPSAVQTCVNVFFNILAEGALVLMDVVTVALNRLAIPFALKILNDPLLYRRYNAATLEVEAAHYVHLRSVLQESYSRLRFNLRDPIPLFTQPLAPGIGIAESPVAEVDFGMARCQILAEALLDSDPNPQSRQRAIQEQFAQRSLDWQRPHLNPQSVTVYPPLDEAVLSLGA